MTHEERMFEHLQRAQELNDEVDAMEADALIELGARPGETIDNDAKAWQVKRHFENKSLYRQKGNARDLHIRMATMYGIAALVATQEPKGQRTPWNPFVGEPRGSDDPRDRRE